MFAIWFGHFGGCEVEPIDLEWLKPPHVGWFASFGIIYSIPRFIIQPCASLPL